MDTNYLNRIWISSAVFFSYVGKRREPSLGPRDVDGEKKERGLEEGGGHLNVVFLVTVARGYGRGLILFRSY